ncbi:PLDc_N domain-containing protein [Enterococcus faecalis]|nr:PLDc_N domain-containing protein [Enterococcus faecalis]
MINDEIAGLLGFGLFMCIMFSWLILMVCATVSILSSNKDGGTKALWFLACISFPYLGSILWFSVGKKQ